MHEALAERMYRLLKKIQETYKDSPYYVMHLLYEALDYCKYSSEELNSDYAQEDIQRALTAYRECPYFRPVS